VLTHGGLSQGQDLDNFAADAVIDGLQVLYDPKPGRMPQRFADVGKSLVIQGRFNLLIHGRFRFVGAGPCLFIVDRRYTIEYLLSTVGFPLITKRSNYRFLWVKPFINQGNN
jgi:hypothetical protein